MFEKFKVIIRQDIEEFIATSRLSKAVELSAKTGQHFNHNEYPLYFTEKLDAKIVLVHLNPKQKNNYADVYKGALSLESFEDYFDYHQNFGMYKYGKATSRTPGATGSLSARGTRRWYPPDLASGRICEHTLFLNGGLRDGKTYCEFL